MSNTSIMSNTSVMSNMSVMSIVSDAMARTLTVLRRHLHVLQAGLFHELFAVIQVNRRHAQDDL